MKKTFPYIFWFYAITLFILNIIPDISAPKVEKGLNLIRMDYLIHFVAYCIAGSLFAVWYKFRPKHFNIYMIAFIALFYASISEVIQIWIVGRTFNPVDLILNCLGISAGISGRWFLLRKKSANQ